MKIDEDFLKKILVDSGMISGADFDSAKKQAVEQETDLETSLIDNKFIADEQLGELIADKIDFPFVNLRKIKIPEELLEIVPEIVAKTRGIIIFGRDREGLRVALSDPADLETREFIERKTGEKVIPYFATSRDLKEALRFYKGELKEELETLAGKTIKEIEAKIGEPEAVNLPVAKIIDLILTSGYENRASDVHLEPYSDKTILRFRIDGILHDVLVLPKFCHEILLSRIKILSELRTDIHETAQDGRFTFGKGKEKIDVRVSIVPIQEGEKAVLRLLSEKARRFALADLGLGEGQLKVLERNLKKPWGMILVSGPAGSGKTTTLYGMLKVLNTRRVNIMTIEDPVEYDVEGINQIQVNPKTNLTFADGLKAIIRQNPDIIMVGEIRDKETASLAVNAAMTGHLVFSTFHANNSATTLPRLEDMGAEPFLITSTVNMIIAQRLVRKICPKCIESYEIPASRLPLFFANNPFMELKKKRNVKLRGNHVALRNGKVRLFRGRGCSLCQKTGYLGRTGVFEILEMSDPIKKLVMARANAGQIEEEARRLGMKTIVEDGWEKAEKGITTLDEVLRVIHE